MINNKIFRQIYDNEPQPPDIEAIPSQIRELDEITGGLKAGQVWLISSILPGLAEAFCVDTALKAACKGFTAACAAAPANLKEKLGSGLYDCDSLTYLPLYTFEDDSKTILKSSNGIRVLTLKDNELLTDATVLKCTALKNKQTILLSTESKEIYKKYSQYADINLVLRDYPKLNHLECIYIRRDAEFHKLILRHTTHIKYFGSVSDPKTRFI